MTTNNKNVRIFMIPLTFPCGTGTTCCSMGQSEEEIQSLKSTIEKETGYQIEVVNVMNSDISNHPQVDQLLRSFGANALPIITLDDEIVSIGAPLPEEAVSALKERMNQTG